MRSALIIKLGAIGDVVMLIPAVHELHRAGYQVDWMCGAAVLPVLELYGWIRPIVVDERGLLKGGAQQRARVLMKAWREARRAGRYELVATMYYDRRYRALTLPVRARRRVQLSGGNRRFRLLPGRHHTDEYARILLGWEDTLRPVPLRPLRAKGLPASPIPRGEKERVVLAAGGARNLLADDALRRWPIENYVALARLLEGRGVEVVLTGGPEDGWLLPHFDGLNVVNCVDMQGLQQTLALLDSDAVLVTHDTGPLHLAGITSAGIVAVFGPTDPRGRLPQREGTVALWGGEGFACRPCYDGQRYAQCPANDCMRQVTVEMVFDEVIQMFEDRRRGVMRAPRVVTPESTVGGLVRVDRVEAR